MRERTATRPSIRREQIVLLGLLALMSGLAWIYMAHVSAQMHGVRLQPWGHAEVLLTFGMWCVMMVAMMLPSAAPMVLTFSSVSRRRFDAAGRRTIVFVLGYLAVWVLYSAGATLVQWGIHSAALHLPRTEGAGPYVAGGVLAAAGVFQLTPLKHACLSRCRTPVGFLMMEWRTGLRGAWVMGLRHGGYCAGCCWALMALMFVLGTMNLLWMAALAAFCAIEKIAPQGRGVGRLSGLLLIGWGASVLVGSLP